jgi:AcrR family transcriptional regulator
VDDHVIETAEPDGGDSTPLDTAKRRQILDGARRVFFERGFEAASMNDITRAAGVSKGTVYAYFPSKEALFAALVGIEKGEQAERLLDLDRRNPAIEQVLETLGVRLIMKISSPEAVARLRLVVGVAPRFPEIGRAIYEAGPKFATAKLGDYLAAMAAEGRIAVDEPHRAARQFLDLCLSDISRRTIFGLETDVTEEEAHAMVRAATAMFLRAYPLTPA